LIFRHVQFILWLFFDFTVIFAVTLGAIYLIICFVNFHTSFIHIVANSFFLLQSVLEFLVFKFCLESLNPGMEKYISNFYSILRLGRQKFFQEICTIFADLFFDFEVIFDNVFKYLYVFLFTVFIRFCSERRISMEQFIEQYAERPHVYSTIIRRLVDNFRRHVFVGPTESASITNSQFHTPPKIA